MRVDLVAGRVGGVQHFLFQSFALIMNLEQNFFLILDKGDDDLAKLLLIRIGYRIANILNDTQVSIDGG